MANVVKIKNSGTASSVPASLQHGEIAINYTDGKLFYKNGSNTIVPFTLTDAAGDLNIDGGSAATIYSSGNVDQIDGGGA